MLLLQYNWFRYDQDKSTAVKVTHSIESKESLTFGNEDLLRWYLTMKTSILKLWRLETSGCRMYS